MDVPVPVAVYTRYFHCEPLPGPHNVQMPGKDLGVVEEKPGYLVSHCMGGMHVLACIFKLLLLEYNFNIVIFLTTNRVKL